MYSAFQLAKKYVSYYLNAQNSKGHGVHSPFVFDFIRNILNDKKNYDCYKKIEPFRKKLLNNHSIIEVEDFGAGSFAVPFKKRKINEIASSSLKNEKFAKLLFRIVKYYKPSTIIELGTSLGITTSYLACAGDTSEIITFEGSTEIATIARNNFNQLGLKNIKLIEGNFNNTLPQILSSINLINLAFIDGNHSKKPTLEYFDTLKKKSLSSSIFIFDDIHWSREMEEAWKCIQADNEVTLTIDLFFTGIVFFNHDFKVKQHFIIRF